MPAPLHYEIDAARRCVRVIYNLQPEFPEWVATMEAIFKDPGYQPGFGILLDRRYVTRPASTVYMQNLVNYVERNGARNGQGRWALLVTDPASFGMARMAEQLGASGLIRAFREVDKAEAWVAGEN